MNGTTEMFHLTWNVRMLASLHRLGGGARFVVLVHDLGGSQSAIRGSLNALLDARMIARNSGYGHPLRPEYVLTDSGRHVAAACQHYDQIAVQYGVVDAAYRKWSAPVLATLHQGNTRFNSIRAALPDVSPRALSTCLKTLLDANLVVRDINATYPPRITYKLSAEGVDLATATERIATAI